MRDLAHPGEVIDDRYRILQRIGRGAVAEVYAARDEVEGREVALKIVRKRLLGEPGTIDRLRREARVQVMIDHPNVAKLHGGGVTARGEPYLALELLRGRSLKDVVTSSGPVRPSRAASYAWQALQGLAATHRAGVLHRDLKPANLMLEPSPGPVERVVLIDFGFASLEGGSRLTVQGHVVGSLGYLAPERLLGEEGDERSDLYALGVILYELLAGRRPFLAESDMDLINLHLEEPPVPPRRALPGASIPAPLEALVLQALAKEPAARFASALAMASAIEEAASSIES